MLPQQPLDIFLGPYIPPQNLTREAAEGAASHPMSYAHTIAAATIVGGERGAFDSSGDTRLCGLDKPSHNINNT